MRFERLDLAPYGRFDKLRLVFSPDAALHVVLGRNEAGKTTTLEAIKDFLFGVEARTAYAFDHSYDALRIGAALRFADGARFEARRRKGRTNTLVDDANKPVSDERLLHALAGVERATFEAEFGLSQQSLREGGADLLRAEGQLAETLAAGSASLGALVKLRDRLEEEAGKLFTPRLSRDKDFYVALESYKTADRSLHDAVVRADELKRADHKRAEALDAEQRTREEQEEASRRLAIRERAGRTHQTLARLEAIAREAADFADLPEIDAGALAAARKALDEDRALRATLAQLGVEAQAEADEIAARVVDRALLDDGGAIERASAPARPSAKPRNSAAPPIRVRSRTRNRCAADWTRSPSASPTPKGCDANARASTGSRANWRRPPRSWTRRSPTSTRSPARPFPPPPTSPLSPRPIRRGRRRAKSPRARRRRRRGRLRRLKPASRRASATPPAPRAPTGSPRARLASAASTGSTTSSTATAGRCANPSNRRGR